MIEVGGTGREAPQKLTHTAEVVQTVLPLEWSRRKRGAGLNNPVPRFRRRKDNGKNPTGQGFKSGDFSALCAEKYFSSLDGLDRSNFGMHILESNESGREVHKILIEYIRKMLYAVKYLMVCCNQSTGNVAI